MREPHAPEWDSLAKAGLLQSETVPIQKSTTKNIYVDVRVTAEAGRWPLPARPSPLTSPTSRTSSTPCATEPGSTVPPSWPTNRAWPCSGRTRPSRPAASSSSGRRCSKHEPRGTDLSPAVGGALLAVLVLAAGAPGQTADPAPAQNRKHIVWDGNRTLPAHFIPLRDENDEIIVPTETDPLPFSARTTCGPCHDYDKIRSGWHFGAMTAAKSGRPGEPWLQVDPKTGTILPLSYRKWPGTFGPAAVGLTAWDFTLLFGRHLPGGGPAEPPAAEVEAHPEARWSVSGRAEVNCLACHNRSGRQDHSEWAKQVLRENLRWAATAAAGVGEVGGMASRLKETWDIVDGPNVDDHEWAVVPSVKYRTVDFDAKHRYFFDLNYRPSDDRCLTCHSVAPKDASMWSADADVHAAAGLKCVDCHRNDLGHAIVRGYEGEAAETGNKTAAAFTCRGCHLGEDADGGKTVAPGRLGAPHPKHTGIPLVHFKRLACTVCHSGPKPQEGFTRVRTSRANRLGVYGVATWSTDAPAILEPVYQKDAAHKIAPHRLVWPAFWALRSGQDLTPLKPGTVEAAAGDILKPEEHVAKVLIALSQVMAEDETPVLASGQVHLRRRTSTAASTRRRGRERSRRPRRSGGSARAPEVLPLVPDFDPAAADKDPAIETRYPGIPPSLGHRHRKTGRARDPRPQDALPVRRRLSRHLRSSSRSWPGPPARDGSWTRSSCPSRQSTTSGP